MENLPLCACGGFKVRRICGFRV